MWKDVYCSQNSRRLNKASPKPCCQPFHFQFQPSFPKSFIAMFKSMSKLSFGSSKKLASSSSSSSSSSVTTSGVTPVKVVINTSGQNMSGEGQDRAESVVRQRLRLKREAEDFETKARREQGVTAANREVALLVEERK